MLIEKPLKRICQKISSKGASD